MRTTKRSERSAKTTKCFHPFYMPGQQNWCIVRATSVPVYTAATAAAVRECTPRNATRESTAV